MARYREHYEFYLALLWKEILGVRQVPIENDFFALGGDAAAARTMLADVEREFGVRVTADHFAAAPTVEALARHVREARQASAAPQKPFRVPGSPAGPIPLVYLYTVEGELTYSDRMLTADLGVPIVAVRSIGMDMEEEPLSTVEAMAARHVADLDELGVRPPYFVVGVCTSGNIAFEMARIWQERGDHVAFLGLFEPPLMREIQQDKAYFVQDHVRELCKVSEVDFTPDRLDQCVQALRESGEIPESFSDELFMRQAEVHALNVLAAYKYRPAGRFTGHAVFYESQAFDCGPAGLARLSDPQTATNVYESFWSQYIPAETLVRRQDCDHRSIDLTRKAREFLREDIAHALNALNSAVPTSI
ncbi:thioesterase domain-containing protein [Kutzneria sp. CA-103260]|uniref:thioesterase domain-containing protein n=1 Tax=Kutzneria sp. CA-103260 TaxID=2802641 RepID=UPI001BA585DE|nr:phosphopantetheine-binding protein [Kutzneria sp. CA-103260]QUQ67500.1 Dimodular nonribosomal peptide synthase [Kutzneria sp. CA-103260]